MHLDSFDVTIVLGTPTIFHCPEGKVESSVINCTPQEAFALVNMPSFAGCISKLVPIYVPDELPEVPQE